MLISALCDYYDALAHDGKVTPEEYSKQAVHYLIALNLDGTIDNIIDWQIKQLIPLKNGKTKETLAPRTVILPKRTEKTAIDFNMAEHRPLYIFGLDADTKNQVYCVTDKATKSHAVFKEKSLEYINGINSPVVNAFRNFLKNWMPENETDNLYLNDIFKVYNKSSYAFCLSGRPDVLLHDDPQIKEVWERIYSETNSGEGCLAQCAVTGEKLPIARIHNKLKGVAGGQPSGTVLIGFKTSAGWSYGNDQSYNSNISEQVMQKYTYALNYLLADKEHKQLIDDITVLFWVEGGARNEVYSNYLSSFLFGENDKLNEGQTNEMLKGLMLKAHDGRVSYDLFDIANNLDETVNFYIVGIKPNSARVSLKFIYRRRIGEVFKAIAQHQSDMQIGKDFKQIPIWTIKKELKSTKSDKESVHSSLMTLLFKSIIYGTPYPNYLLVNMVNRIKTDRYINQVRAGIVKACINRKLRSSGQKEELQLALDKQNTNQAYLCGRLFAVLEHIQQSASSAKLNRTIKDAYFSSAASKPALVFPKLISLSQNHIKKLSEKSTVFYNKLAEEIIEKLNGEFPDTLTLIDQGKFIIGYYHQDQDFYQKQSDNIKEE